MNLRDKSETHDAGAPAMTVTFLSTGCAILCSLATIFTVSAGANTTSTNAPTWEQMRAKWAGLRAAEVEAAAASGDAEAQYFFGMIETQAAARDQYIAYRQWDAFSRLDPSGQTATNASAVPRTNWAGIEEELVHRALSGDRDAQRRITNLDTDRAGERQRSAFIWLQKAANQSFVPAVYEVAWSYLRLADSGTKSTSTEEGLKLLGKAVAANYPNAQNRMAELLLGGAVIPADLPRAIHLLRQAVDGGSARAKFNLAVQYAAGNGEPRSPAETPVALLRQASEAGVVQAQIVLAERCWTGLGTPTDYFEAVYWYRKAAASGQDAGRPFDSSLKRMISQLKSGGQSVGSESSVNPELAKVSELHLHAVILRQAESQREVGDYYARRLELPQHTARAFFWYERAAEQGLTIAAELRDRLKASLTPEDLQCVWWWRKEFFAEPK